MDFSGLRSFSAWLRSTDERWTHRACRAVDGALAGGLCGGLHQGEEEIDGGG